MKLHDPIIYVDEYGVKRGAILSTIWGGQPLKTSATGATEIADDGDMPAVNLAFTSGDESRSDNAGYGRQIERRSSCVHMRNQSAHGNYWRRIDEVGKDTEQDA